ncbi:MAG: Low specificity L-threonine aldolase [Verrucomicrobia subdivision 3 bacterium]|nr:Low specificity L-threonine aldolase [Limisphaerales bacterium]MCS1413051.1 Low specificity L-threonine aldolase [Limisphaerales bacterium]
MSKKLRHFASDNYAGVCPEAWTALEEANAGHAVGYGDDAWTQRAADKIREVFETNCEVFFVFNGTAANSLALASLCQSYHSILCHDYAHVERDECGAPEFFSNGTKVLLVTGENGKMSPDAIEECVKRRTDIHYPKPKVVTVTQSTELGTVYTVDELQAIGCRAKYLGLKLHMDGARFANAVASLNVAPKEITWQSGVDVLCFGGTKNGTPVGDAVVFFNRDLAAEFDYRCKQAGQLASKMRYLAAPWVVMLQDGVWLKHAGRANAMAKRLHDAIDSMPGLRVMFPQQANAVFVEMPQTGIRALHERGWQFYTFIGEGGCRLMCSWDTTEEDVEDFIRDLKSIAGAL